MTSFTEIHVPEGVGSADDEIALSTWYFDDGDRVDEESIVCQLMVSKTSYDVYAPVAGVLRHVAEPEAIVQVGDLIARIET